LSATALSQRIEAISERPEDFSQAQKREAFEELKSGLNDGSIRAAEREDGRWVARPWVKKGILLGFRIGRLQRMVVECGFPFFDKDTMSLKALTTESAVRVVPGGTAIRDGCYLAPGVTLMPPAYVNIGAYVGAGTMIDSHALVGSCAQIGERVHLSAAAQIGGVLEPVGQLPVIVEDDVLVGGNCGIYEGAIVRARCVLAAGVILTGGTPVYDLVTGRELRRRGSDPLEIPEGAVVVPGARAVGEGKGRDWGLSLQTPVIVKYRDAKTERSISLEDLLR
jgi:2,3,4,5-tetrahydropyridine-2,6-dicarboxylate N-succinyltransferase